MFITVAVDNPSHLLIISEAELMIGNAVSSPDCLLNYFKQYSRENKNEFMEYYADRND